MVQNNKKNVQNNIYIINLQQCIITDDEHDDVKVHTFLTNKCLNSNFFSYVCLQILPPNPLKIWMS